MSRRPAQDPHSSFFHITGSPALVGTSQVHPDRPSQVPRLVVQVTSCCQFPFHLLEQLHINILYSRESEYGIPCTRSACLLHQLTLSPLGLLTVVAARLPFKTLQTELYLERFLLLPA